MDYLPYEDEFFKSSLTNGYKSCYVEALKFGVFFLLFKYRERKGKKNEKEKGKKRRTRTVNSESIVFDCHQ